MYHGVVTSVSTLSGCKPAFLLVVILLQDFDHMRFGHGEGRMRGCIDEKGMICGDVCVIIFVFSLVMTFAPV